MVIELRISFVVGKSVRDTVITTLNFPCRNVDNICKSLAIISKLRFCFVDIIKTGGRSSPSFCCFVEKE